MFPMGAEPNYEPDESDSIAALAARQGRRPELVVIDSLLEQEGHALNYFPIMNYTHGNLDDVRSDDAPTHAIRPFGCGCSLRRPLRCEFSDDYAHPLGARSHPGRGLAFALADSCLT